MTIVEFAEFLVTHLVKEEDMVRVKDYDTEEGLIIEILVPETDMGRVIGKNGKTSTSIRTLIQAFAAINNMPKVKINIDSF